MYVRCSCRVLNYVHNGAQVQQECFRDVAIYWDDLRQTVRGSFEGEVDMGGGVWRNKCKNNKTPFGSAWELNTQNWGRQTDI